MQTARMIAILCLSLLSLLSCNKKHANEYDCKWDDTYRSVIENTVIYGTSNDASDIRKELMRQAIGIYSRGERAKLLTEVQAHYEYSQKIRMEGFIPYDATYVGIWILYKPESQPLVIAWGRYGLKVVEISSNEWQDFTVLISNSVLRGSVYRKSMDGPGFFVSWSLPGYCGQYAMYSPVIPPIPSEKDKEFEKKTVQEKQLVDRLFLLLRRIDKN